MLEIRKALPTDVSTLAKIERSCFEYYVLTESHFKKILKSHSSKIFVATLNQEIAGFLMMMTRVNSKQARIYSLAVDEKFRNNRIGSHLISYCENEAKNLGRKSIILEVMKGNSEGIKFYQKHGYKEHLLREDYYENGVHALRMLKEI